MNNEPVAWLSPDNFYVCPEADYQVSITTEHPKDLGWFPLYTHPAKTLTNEDAKQKLIRVMGTFDLATGHADTFDELLDSLNLELHDILGHYRQAIKQKLKENGFPVAWVKFNEDEVITHAELSDGYSCDFDVIRAGYTPLYTHSADLTDEEIAEEWAKFYPDVFHTHLINFVRAILKKASEK
jgi:hypothetical protein